MLGFIQFPDVDLTPQRLSYVATRVGRRLGNVSCMLRPRLVRFDNLLCGGEHGMSAAQYARATGAFLRPSTPFRQSPQVQLLKRYQEIGDDVFRPEVFRSTSYYVNAIESINTVGNYFTCTHPDEVEGIARHFVGRFRGDSAPTPAVKSDTITASWWLLPRVRRIRHSECFEVVDGNHRLAMDLARGREQAWVWVVGPPAVTPLQQMILDVSWTKGAREIYQPIDAPELGRKWITVRRCTERFEAIQTFLGAHGLMPPECRTYLDVACSYGWFVRAFEQAGFTVHGAEIDWASIQIGRLVYGLKPDRVTRTNVVDFLQRDSQRYDVVSCFSLLHHFVLGRGRISAEELLGRIDQKTKRVFFFDTGQEHESWFRTSLAGWNPDRIEAWIKAHSTFSTVHRLAADADSVPPFSRNYGRTLFACLRS